MSRHFLVSAPTFAEDAVRVGPPLPLPQDPRPSFETLLAPARAHAWLASRHIRQSPSTYAATLTVAEPDALPRVLDDDAPRSPYRRRRNAYKTVSTWPERSALLAVVEFLTRFGPSARTVVLAGDPPRPSCLAWLAVQFPNLAFHVHAGGLAFDSPDEVWGPAGNPDPDASLLILAPAAAAVRALASDAQVQAASSEAMALHARWIERLCPRAALMPFHLPWGQGSTSFFDGTLMLPVWGTATTTETRLVVQPRSSGELPRRPWDHTRYEEQMFHFNTVTRVAPYANPLISVVPGVCACYDCTAEFVILRNLLARSFDPASADYADLVRATGELMADLHHVLETERTLAVVVGVDTIGGKRKRGPAPGSRPSSRPGPRTPHSSQPSAVRTSGPRGPRPPPPPPPPVPRHSHNHKHGRRASLPPLPPPPPPPPHHHHSHRRPSSQLPAAAQDHDDNDNDDNNNNSDDDDDNPYIDSEPPPKRRKTLDDLA